METDPKQVGKLKSFLGGAGETATPIPPREIELDDSFPGTVGHVVQQQPSQAEELAKIEAQLRGEQAADLPSAGVQHRSELLDQAKPILMAMAADFAEANGLDTATLLGLDPGDPAGDRTAFIEVDREAGTITTIDPAQIHNYDPTIPGDRERAEALAKANDSTWDEAWSNAGTKFDPSNGDDQTVITFPEGVEAALTDPRPDPMAERLNVLRGVAARIWTDPDYSSVVMDVGAAEAIARILLRVELGIPLHDVYTDHSLTVIGSPPKRMTYLDVPEAEAIRRYTAEVGAPEAVLRSRGLITTFTITDQFECSDAWPLPEKV